MEMSSIFLVFHGYVIYLYFTMAYGYTEPIVARLCLED